MKEIALQNESLQREQRLEKERNKLKKRKKIGASKIALMVMFIVVFQIVLFTEFVMWETQDLSALYVLIGIPATMIVPLWKFYSKSEAENTRGGIIYDAAMKQMDSIQTSSEEVPICDPGCDPVQDQGLEHLGED